MGPQSGSSMRLVRFGVFELDVSAGELRKHGHRIRLQEQPLRLLICLVENSGAVVSREALTRTIWPEGTFVDYENGLNTAVARLRQALRDSAENPRYIETIARRGYRFVAPIAEITDAELAPSQEIPPAPEQSVAPRVVKPKSPSRLTPLWLGLGAVVIAMLSFMLFRIRPATDGSTMYAGRPLTTYPGSEIAPSFSPDGDRVAFSWDGENQNNFDILHQTDRCGDTGPPY
jgi:DNA-binding winged helix-turn-helix (wHTH) protein